MQNRQMKEAGIPYADIAAATGRPKDSCQQFYHQQKKIGALQQWRVKESNKPKEDHSKPKATAMIIPRHDEYVGKRPPGPLRDSGWPDMQRMLDKGAPITLLATHYGSDRHTVQAFVDKKRAETIK